jgi:DNA-binding beta-propeller fold protein YncE
MMSWFNSAQRYVTTIASESLSLLDLTPGRVFDVMRRLVYTCCKTYITCHAVDNDTSVNVIAGHKDQYGCKDGSFTDARFKHACALVLTRDGRKLYVCDDYCDNIRLVDLDAKLVTTVVGRNEENISDWYNGNSNVVPILWSPSAISLDADEKNLFVVDSSNHRIRCIELQRKIITTVAGNPIIPPVIEASGPVCAPRNPKGAFQNGAGSQSQFDVPIDLVLDAHGDIFIADHNNHRIRCIDGNTFQVTTIIGNGIDAFKNGATTEACFSSPSRIALYGHGDLLLCCRPYDSSREIWYRIHNVAAPYTAVSLFAFVDDLFRGDNKITCVGFLPKVTVQLIIEYIVARGSQLQGQ